jgi:DnaJ-class molecular chaperone
MRMSTGEALKVLDLYGQSISRELIKGAYRKLAARYHPDRNPNGLEQMKTINGAYQYLQDLSDSELERFSPDTQEKRERREAYQNGDNLSVALFARGLYSFMRDDKMWVDGNTFNHREFLKSKGFRWNPDEKMWWRHA